MRQVLSWALARSPGAEPGVRAVGALLRGGLVPSAIGRADEFLTEVALIAHTARPQAARALDDAPNPGGSQVVDGAGQRPGHPDEIAGGPGNDLQVHAVRLCLPE
jgi:hypothetical protein